MEEEIIKISEEIGSSEMLSPYILDVKIIENSSGRFIDLINNEDEFEYTLKNKYYTFRFHNPMYINQVKFSSRGSSNLKGLEIVSKNIHGEESTTSFNNKHSIWSPKKIITEFRIKAPERYFNKIILTKIEMFGFSLEDLNKVKSNVEEIRNYKTALQKVAEDLQARDDTLNDKTAKIDSEIEEKNLAIETLKKELEEVQIELQPLKDEKDELAEEVKDYKFTSTKLNDNITESNNNSSQLKQEIDELNINISSKKSELRQLTEDTNVFAVDMKEYNKQSGKDIKLYFILSLIPWILILTVTIIIFVGTSDLSTIYNPNIEGRDNKIDINAVFWSRLPFAIIASSILFVSYEVSKIFIKNIIQIKKQNQALTKINIIANDVADKSILDLDIPENDKFELRTKLKMDLLREHLKNEVGEEYEYKLRTSLWDYLKPRKKVKKQTATENQSVEIKEDDE